MQNSVKVITTDGNFYTQQYRVEKEIKNACINSLSNYFNRTFNHVDIPTPAL